MQRRAEVWKSGGLEAWSRAAGAATWKYGALELQSRVAGAATCGGMEIQRSGGSEPRCRCSDVKVRSAGVAMKA